MAAAVAPAAAATTVVVPEPMITLAVPAAADRASLTLHMLLRQHSLLVPVQRLAIHQTHLGVLLATVAWLEITVVIPG
jgi:hypothetical protein